MQPTHLAPLFQVLRRDGRVLALALGAIAGAAAYFGWPQDIGWAFGLWPVGVGLILLGLRNQEPGTRNQVWGHVGWVLVVAGLVFMLAGHQVEQEEPEKGGLNWAAASRKAHWVVGRVAEIQEQKDEAEKERRGPERVTVVLKDVRFFQLSGSEGIEEVRVGVFANQVREAGLKVGDGAAVPVLLVAPEGPKFKGDRDARLWRYLDHVQVRAFARGTLEKTVLPDRNMGPGDRVVGKVSSLQQGLEGVRAAIDARTAGIGGGVVTALLTGNQRGLDPQLREAYRAAGLTHLIAISGMQLTVVAGGIFFLVRWLASLWPALALRVDIKAVAAVMGLLGAAGYTLLAGAGVSVVRAFVMVALVMMAVLAGRLRGSVRAWAVAVVVILLFSPVMVVNAGFQLSVAAVLALLLWGVVEELPRGVWGWGRGVVLSSVVAGAATAPLVVWNFGQLSAVGVLANVVAVPLMAVATYVGMAALVLWPVGGEGPALEAMGWVVEGVNRLALAFAGWQGNVRVGVGWVPVVGALSAMVLGGVLTRRWGVMWGGVLATALLGWGVARYTAVPEVVLMDGGRIGVRLSDSGFRGVMWAEDVREARYVLDRAGYKGLDLGPETAEFADMQWWPPVGEEKFAWAEFRDGKWFVKHLECDRVWERVEEGCRG